MMRFHFKRGMLVFLCLCMIFPLFASPALGLDTEEEQPQVAENISHVKYITECEGFPTYGYFFDGQVLYGGKSTGNGHFTVEHADGVGSIYIIFQEEFGPYKVINNDTGIEVTVGEGYFLHDFLNMQELFGTCPKSVTVRFSGNVAQINEMYLFTPGQVPDFVQQWEMPADGETDLVLFSTHGDDEQLFFAGALPYYGGELGYQVQVVYMTNHWNNSSIRIHEMLNGLWAVGVKAYPVFGEYEDFKAGDLKTAYEKFNNLGWSKEHILGFVVEQMRRFKPKVVLAHDFDGEYRHGQHMVYADMVAKALEVSNDPAQFPDTANLYGVWDVPKAYFHLYEENAIVMDWDQPLESFDGETAFEVSINRGFQCHKTQIEDFAWYYRGCKKAIEVKEYGPCYYGLYRTTVGPDVEKNDFFENVNTHAQDKRMEQEKLEQEQQAQLEKEQQAQLEKEMQAQQEKERQEQQEKERLEKEQQEQLEKERLEQQKKDQLAQLEKERLEAQQKEQQRQDQLAQNTQHTWLLIIALVIAAAMIVCVCAMITLLRHEKHRKKRRRKNI